MVRAVIVSFFVVASSLAPVPASAQTDVVASDSAASSAISPEGQESDSSVAGSDLQLPTTAALADPSLLSQQAGADPSLSQQAGTARPVAFEYSDGYALRRKIHVYASLATVPLFVTQYVLGQKLYDGDASDSVRSAHAAVGAGIGVLFGANTVTGVWNMWEARKDPNGRKRRLIHGLSMLGADVGFLATSMTAPDDDEGEGDRSLHRNLALTSVGIATASYLYMLFTR